MRAGVYPTSEMLHNVFLNGRLPIIDAILDKLLVIVSQRVPPVHELSFDAVPDSYQIPFPRNVPLHEFLSTADKLIKFGVYNKSHFWGNVLASAVGHCDSATLLELISAGAVVNFKALSEGITKIEPHVFDTLLQNAIGGLNNTELNSLLESCLKLNQDSTKAIILAQPGLRITLDVANDFLFVWLRIEDIKSREDYIVRVEAKLRMCQAALDKFHPTIYEDSTLILIMLRRYRMSTEDSDFYQDVALVLRCVDMLKQRGYTFDENVAAMAKLSRWKSVMRACGIQEKEMEGVKLLPEIHGPPYYGDS
ncbi:hypothetical protein HDV05_006679 [Chytridiales sp. JEL 0842]|nr:hypothetical protein HDV05_006679 [Chytridiales sp. JEL 0842]